MTRIPTPFKLELDGMLKAFSLLSAVRLYSCFQVVTRFQATDSTVVLLVQSDDLCSSSVPQFNRQVLLSLLPILNLAGREVQLLLTPSKGICVWLVVCQERQEFVHQVRATQPSAASGANTVHMRTPKVTVILKFFMQKIRQASPLLPILQILVSLLSFKFPPRSQQRRET